MGRWITILAALVACGGAWAGIQVSAPASLAAGESGTVTVTVTNTNQPTAARDVTLTATLYYTEGSLSRKVASDPVTVHLDAGEGLPYHKPFYAFPVVEGLVYDWDKVTFAGDAVRPYMDSAHTTAAESLGPGGTWSTTVPVKAP